jgi:hypothetical protein
MVRGSNGRNTSPPKQAGRERENHDKCGIRRPRAYRSAGARGILFQSDRLHQDGDPQPACRSFGRCQAINRPHNLELGWRRYGREELETAKTEGSKLRIQVIGLATIDEDVSPELALATIESITVLGTLHASKAVKLALSDRVG